MFSDIEFNNLKKKYGSFASWAIWDYKNQSDTSIIDKNKSILHSKFVLLALNFSLDTNIISWRDWSNFHYGPSNVRKLKYACNNSFLKGSYMTDLFKNMVEKNSGKVGSLLNENIIKKNIEIFNEEMKNIKINKNSKFIIWGVPSSNIASYFNKYFRQNYSNPIIYHTHYSYYGISDREWVTSLWKKLNIIQDFDETIKKYR